MTTTRVTGLAGLKAKFDALPDKVARKVLRGGVVAGARIVRAAAAARAPVAAHAIPRGRGRKTAPGTLRRAAIIKFIPEQSNATQVVYFVTFRQGKRQQKSNRDAFYAKWVERGHRIVPRSRRIGTVGGKAVYRKTIRARRAGSSRSVKGVFFLAKAFAATQSAAVDSMVRNMSRSLDKVTKE